MPKATNVTECCDRLQPGHNPQYREWYQTGNLDHKREPSGQRVDIKFSDSRDRSTAGDQDPVRIEVRGAESNRRSPGFELRRLCCRVVGWVR